MRRPLVAFAASAAVIGLSVLAAEATSIRKMGTVEIARRSSAIVVGTVAGSAPRLASGTGGKTRVFTDYDLRDLSVWKGSVETRNLVLSVVGGSLHGVTLGVEGAPRLEEGRRYLLFLCEEGRLCPIVGWGQGIFPVEEAADGSLRVRRFEGGPVTGLSGGDAVSGEGPALRLEELLSALDREGVRR